ncbi:MAG: L-threonylcarbamoyladenylate synthase [Henriciella sp.]
MNARFLPGTADGISAAATILHNGGLVAMPTETVYGLAANAADDAAVARIYSAKGRPQFNPLIAHVSSMEMALREGIFQANALKLADAFWPGPLTLVVAVAPSGSVSELARAGLESIALRMPRHPIARDLIKTFGGPIVAPSANPSGKISPTRPEHVSADMGDRVDLILDGGACAAGVESTIIDARGDRPALLRPGSMDPADIERVWPGLIRPSLDPDAPQSPGQLLRHYAPNAKLRLNAKTPDTGEAYLGFGAGEATLNLSEAADLTEAAANLFAMLRDLDARFDRIAVAPIPNNGLGEAINDRLTRAAK